MAPSGGKDRRSSTGSNKSDFQLEMAREQRARTRRTSQETLYSHLNSIFPSLVYTSRLESIASRPIASSLLTPH